MNCDCGYAFVCGVCPDVCCIFERGALIPDMRVSCGVLFPPRVVKHGEAYRGDVLSKLARDPGHGGAVGSSKVVRGKGDYKVQEKA